MILKPEQVDVQFTKQDRAVAQVFKLLLAHAKERRYNDVTGNKAIDKGNDHESDTLRQNV